MTSPWLAACRVLELAIGTEGACCCRRAAAGAGCSTGKLLPPSMLPPPPVLTPQSRCKAAGCCARCSYSCRAAAWRSTSAGVLVFSARACRPADSSSFNALYTRRWRATGSLPWNASDTTSTLRAKQSSRVAHVHGNVHEKVKDVTLQAALHRDACASHSHPSRSVMPHWPRR